MSRPPPYHASLFPTSTGDTLNDDDRTDTSETKPTATDTAKRLALVRLSLMRRAIEERRQGRADDVGTTADPLRDFWRNYG